MSTLSPVPGLIRRFIDPEPVSIRCPAKAIVRRRSSCRFYNGEAEFTHGATSARSKSC